MYVQVWGGFDAQGLRRGQGVAFDGIRGRKRIMKSSALVLPHAPERLEFRPSVLPTLVPRSSVLLFKIDATSKIVWFLQNSQATG